MKKEIETNAPIIVTLKKGWFDSLKSILWILIVAFFFIFLFSSSTSEIEFQPSHEEVYFDEELNVISEIDSEIPGIGLIDLTGFITTQDVMTPFGEEAVITPNIVRSQFNLLKSEPQIKGVLIRITTPGGMVSASDEIAYLIKDLRNYMPVYVYTEDLMTSGGYYIAVAADKIYAHRQAMVGSIGVVYQIPNFEKLTREKLGIDFEIYKSGQYKDINNPFRARTDDEKKLIQDLVDESFEDFLKIIEENRGFSRDELLALATGEVWSGQKAEEKKIIDKAVYFDELVDEIKKELSIEDQIQFIQYERPKTFFQELLEISGTYFQKPSLDINFERFMKIMPAGLYYL